MSENEQKENKPSTEEVLQALSIYESDWQHRDTYMTKEMYTLFFAAMFCDIVPFLFPSNEIDLSPVVYILFPIIASLLTAYFWFYISACAARVVAASQTVEKMMKLLPHELQRRSITDTSWGNCSYAKAPMSLWTPACMCIGLSILDVGMLGVFIYMAFEDNIVQVFPFLLAAFGAFIVLVWSAIIISTVVKHSRKTICEENNNYHEK